MKRVFLPGVRQFRYRDYGLGDGFADLDSDEGSHCARDWYEGDYVGDGFGDGFNPGCGYNPEYVAVIVRVGE